MVCLLFDFGCFSARGGEDEVGDDRAAGDGEDGVARRAGEPPFGSIYLDVNRVLGGCRAEIEVCASEKMASRRWHWAGGLADLASALASAEGAGLHTGDEHFAEARRVHGEEKRRMKVRQGGEQLRTRLLVLHGLDVELDGSFGKHLAPLHTDLCVS